MPACGTVRASAARGPAAAETTARGPVARGPASDGPVVQRGRGRISAPSVVAALPPAVRGDALLDEVEARIAACLGGLIRFWGFGPHAGRVWTVLYLSPRPLSAPELATRLRMSAGLLSQTLTLLERWGVVTRFRAPGRRLLLHAGTEDVWSIVTRVLSSRELGMVRDLVALAGTAAETARRARTTGADARRAEHVERRVLALRRLARVGETLLTVLLGVGKLDRGRLRGAMRLVSQVPGSVGP
jgi:DNA-binding transcriptional regulator GbsR (MarR family)